MNLIGWDKNSEKYIDKIDKKTVTKCILSINEIEESSMSRKTKSLVLRDGDYEYLRSLIKQRIIQA